MAALTNLEIPSGFRTLEQLGMYVGITMAAVYPDKTYMLTAKTSERVADRAVIRTYDGRDFFVGRFAVPLDPGYTTPEAPLWTYAQENENVTIPLRFKA